MTQEEITKKLGNYIETLHSLCSIFRTTVVY